MKHAYPYKKSNLLNITDELCTPVKGISIRSTTHTILHAHHPRFADQSALSKLFLTSQPKGVK
ncbi:hypothetical protein T05_13812 [Trichinella murrelli]|uniref:Uncharacterized protein n=1 Tax=Trichinella murrelli TaxID=144512 RepID=A0A0V0U3E1_9BILA|nr:hypothetical protein T05_447 [Trichinella murrelli]KRX45758.1 hypothetical protein T05_13812 [Trichinella murrelli]